MSPLLSPTCRIAFASAIAAALVSGCGRSGKPAAPTTKIADQVRGWGLVGPYVTFKAAAPETCLEDLHRIAAAQRARTGSDRVFANVLGRLGTVLWVGEDAIRFDDRRAAVSRLVTWVCGEGA